MAFISKSSSVRPPRRWEVAYTDSSLATSSSGDSAETNPHNHPAGAFSKCRRTENHGPANGKVQGCSWEPLRKRGIVVLKLDLFQCCFENILGLEPSFCPLAALGWIGVGALGGPRHFHRTYAAISAQP
jgi:hypothetical protein